MQNKKLHTIYFSTYDDIKNPHYGGGGAIAVHNIAQKLVKKYDVRVLSWDYSGKKKEKINGVNYERFGLPLLSPKIAMFVYQLTLPFIVLNKQYDVWLESFCPPFTTALLPLFTKKPVIGVVHMLAAEDMERKYKLPFHLIQNVGLRMYKNIIVTSDALKKQIKHISSSSSIAVISNGIERVDKPLQKEKYLLFLGRIEIDQKGLDLLVDAFKKFYAKHKNYKLIVAGTGSVKERSQLKEIISNAGLADAMIIKGKVSGKAKETLLRKASCVVVPSRFETYSLVALEAMASGAPVVCFAIDGLSWIPQTIAKKVTPFDVNALAKTLSVVVSDREVSQKMTKEGNAYAKQFTWEAISKQYQEYLSRMLSEK